MSWQWSRSPSGVWLEIVPSALSAVFALNERTRRSLQSSLFAIADLAAVHPLPGSARNLIIAANGLVLRYSLETAEKRVVIEAVEEANLSRLGMAG
jgi:hypothetical protein